MPCTPRLGARRRTTTAWMLILITMLGSPMAAYDFAPVTALPPPAVEVRKDDGSIREIVYEGVDYRGEPARWFAYLGLPEGASAEAPVPGIVLVHGGGGTAFKNWVELWNRRGYAAIAMALRDKLPRGVDVENMPPCKHHIFTAEAAQGAPEAWTYQAVAATIRARTLLASLPEVADEQVGITGVSWGGYTALIASAVDPGFAFAISVYGCGTLGEASGWDDDIRQLDAAHDGGWTRHNDPVSYLPQSTVPTFWVVRPIDNAYPLPSVARTIAQAPTFAGLSNQVRLQHAHGGPGENPPEATNFAEQALGRGGVQPPTIAPATVRDGLLIAPIDRTVETATLAWTTSGGAWNKRRWQTAPARFEQGHLVADLPDGATAAFLSTEIEVDTPTWVLKRSQPNQGATLVFSSPPWIPEE